MGKLNGKIALITGAARGQGAAEARLFAEEGATVILTDVEDDAGAAVATEIGDTATYAHLDVASESEWQRLAADIEAQHGRLDICVNNAGILRLGPFEHTTLSDYESVIRVNQTGVFLGIRTSIPLMRKAGGGSIINISSIDGLVGMSFAPGYVASKFAVRGMTKAAALELGADNIRVNSIHPGGVNTPMLTGVQSEPREEGSAFSRVPLGRVGEPEEVARLALYLASDDSSYSTGSEFVVDGGLTAGFNLGDVG